MCVMCSPSALAMAMYSSTSRVGSMTATALAFSSPTTYEAIASPGMKRWWKNMGSILPRQAAAAARTIVGEVDGQRLLAFGDAAGALLDGPLGGSVAGFKAAEDELVAAALADADEPVIVSV